MARRRMTVRRIDPWSVLKFGFVANLCLLAIGLVTFGVLWYAIQRIGVIEQACDVARGVGFEECGIDGGNLFRWALLLGLLGVVIQTGLLVFFTFLHNLIADMVGGITVTINEEGAAGRDTVTARTPASVTTGIGTLGTPGAVPPLPPPQPAASLRTDPRHAESATPRPRPDAPPVWPWEREDQTGPVRPSLPPLAPTPPPRREPVRPAAPAAPRRSGPAASPERPPTPTAPAPAARPPGGDRRPSAPARGARTDEQLFGPRPGQDE